MWPVSWEHVWKATYTENIMNNENILYEPLICISSFFKVVMYTWKQMSVNQMIYLTITRQQNEPISKFMSLQLKLVG